jgi:hypothetical protein
LPARESSVWRSVKDAGVHQGRQDRTAGRSVEAPEPLRLLRCEAQTWLFRVITRDPLQENG